MINNEIGGRGGIPSTAANSDTCVSGLANQTPHSAAVSNGEFGAVANLIADIPTDPKAFLPWLVAQKWIDWPDTLRALAYRAYYALKTRDQTAWSQSFALRKAAKADWQAFTTAYAEWEARS